MYLVSSGPSASSVFTTQANDSATEPMANRLTIALRHAPAEEAVQQEAEEREDRNEPEIHLLAAMNAMNANDFMSVFHRADIVDHQRLRDS